MDAQSFTLVSILQFATHVAAAVSDGNLSSDEINLLLGKEGGLQLLLCSAMLVYQKFKNKN